jgi:exopolyphosphatase/guanosine-5'-triphosphate,3'-diphosphate pyrophosphatase
MPTSPTGLMAAIDIGASAIRMDVAEVREGGKLHVLDSLKKGVQLGKDAFTAGVLSEESIRAACAALQDFKRVMDTYGVLRYRAVATSAVRESSNGDRFLDRILMSTGLDVEIIDGPEENRLTLSAVLDSLRGGPSLEEGQSLLVEAGGGSADVTLLSGQEPVQSGTFPLGSIRLRAGVGPDLGTHEKQIRYLTRQISNIIATVRRSIPLKEATNYIALGGDVRFAGRVLCGSQGSEGPCVVARESFEAFVDSVSKLAVEALVQKYSLSYLDAETLVPALLVYLLFLKQTSAQKVIITDASIRAGILQDLAPAEEGARRTKLTHQILSAARSLGRKYQCDENHAERVRALAELLFDELKTEQRLDETHRLYLEVAALLHDIGLFISSRAHHKHSYYLISQSDIFGLRPREREIIANVARYHRRALPQRTHLPFVSLERDERTIVSKLAAILRVANALDREHLQKLDEIKVTRDGDQVVLTAYGVSDLTMERLALASRSDLFREVFGKRIILREAPKTT